MKKKHGIGIAIVIVIAAAYIYLQSQTSILGMFTQRNLQAFFQSYGMAGPLVFIAVQAVAVVFSQLPNIPLTMAAGAIWGPTLGTLYSIIGAMLGACIAFYIARLLGLDAVKKLIGDRYEFVEELPEKYLTLGIFVMRLLPFLSFDVISYGAGLTRIKFRNFFLATLFGMIPMTFLFAYIGERIMVGEVWSWILTGLVVVVMLALPWAWKKYKES